MRGVKTDPVIVQKIVKLRHDGLSLDEICQETHQSKSTVFAYVANIQLANDRILLAKETRRTQLITLNRTRSGKSLPRNQIKKAPKTSSELVRCIAHFMFDGSITRYGVHYYNRSLPLVEAQQQRVREFFGLEGKIIPRLNDVYRLSVFSVELAAAIKIRAKKLLDTIDSHPIEWKRAFLQAFFDDEGNISLSRNGWRRRIRGYQKDKLILKTVHRLLKYFEIHSAFDDTGKALVITGRTNLEKFAQHINFSPSLRINPERKNSLYNHPYSKRDLLEMALNSYRKPS